MTTAPPRLQTLQPRTLTEQETLELEIQKIDNGLNLPYDNAAQLISSSVAGIRKALTQKFDDASMKHGTWAPGQYLKFKATQRGVAHHHIQGVFTSITVPLDPKSYGIVDHTEFPPLAPAYFQCSEFLSRLATMLSLIFTVLFVHIAIYLVNTIGAATIDNLLWHLYLKLPTSTARNAREQQRMKREVVQLKREMNNTSSQDEFAKWAKLRRRHDKSMEDYEAMNKAISSQKTSFDWTVKTARWLSTTGLKIFLQFWYSKTPVFALPPAWFPYYVEWILSFPRAPLGHVSIQVWSNVCATAIAVVGEILGAVVAQGFGAKKDEPTKEKKAQ